MKHMRYNLKTIVLSLLFLWMAITLSFLQPKGLFAEEQIPDAKEKAKGIRIVTDQAVVDSKAHYTEFTGNVRITIDNDTQINADWLKINYNPSAGEDNNLNLSTTSFKEIIAKGNVKIIFDDKVAITEEALYIPDEETLTLRGEDSKISTDNDYIIGDKIILNRKDGTFKVESAGEKQVEAVFFPNP